MYMRFCHSTLLAICFGLPTSQGFHITSIRSLQKTSLNVGGWDNDDFLDALSAGGPGKEEGGMGGDEDEASSGGSKFKEILRQAKAARQQGGEPEMTARRAIDNPFLTPPSPNQSPGNIENLTVEQQAEMFRQMMQTKQGGAGAELPSVSRVSRTDRAGRPVGRNRDADQIANTADVYFAQLKRDSTVRTLARQRGEQYVAEDVFADEGIKELDNLLAENPYLQGQRDKEKSFFDSIPEEVLRPYFGDQKDEQTLTTTGVRYKEMLQKRRMKQQGQENIDPASSSQAPPSLPVSTPQPNPISAVTPETQLPPPPMPSAQKPVAPTQVTAPRIVEADPVTLENTATPTSAEETRTKIRTLMGLLLKHRGGPGFGSGRLKGPEVDRFNTLLEEVTVLLREEAKHAVPLDTTVVSQQPPIAKKEKDGVAVEQAAIPNGVESAMACIDGAVALYKNSPPDTRKGILPALHAALRSSLDTINAALSGQVVAPTPSSGPVDAQMVDGAVACIDGALTMYRNSPTSTRQAILPAVQAALASSLGTINGAVSVNPPPPSLENRIPSSPPSNIDVPDPMPASLAPSVSGQVNDEHSKKLEQLHDMLSVAAGDGSLGLRSNLSSVEASKLADQLIEMRSILMKELDVGISEPKPASQSGSATRGEGSTVSKYQEMLAKAKAAKAAA